MDKMTKHDRVVKSVITEIYEQYGANSEKAEQILVMDEESKNYLLLMNTWVKSSRFYGILIHLQVMEDGRIYVHDDNTDLIVVDWLLERGILKKDMVLGWHTPIMRATTEFATS